MSISIQQSLQAFGTGLATLGSSSYNVYHYYRPMMQAPFVVWAEDSETDDFHADNQKAEVVMAINVDVYTATEFDTLLDDVFNYLNEKQMPFTISSVDYEETTRLIHYSFSTELAVKPYVPET